MRAQKKGFSSSFRALFLLFNAVFEMLSCAQLSSVQLEHAGIELVIPALLLQQGLVVAPLDDPAVLQHQNSVGIAHGG